MVLKKQTKKRIAKSCTDLRYLIHLHKNRGKALAVAVYQGTACFLNAVLEDVLYKMVIGVKLYVDYGHEK